MTLRHLLSGLSLLLLPLACSLATAGAGSAAWTVYKAGEASSAYVQQGSGEKLGLLCLSDMESCVYFLKPLLPCEDGHRVSVRLEGEAGVWRLHGLCSPAGTGMLLLFDEDLGELLNGSSRVEVSLQSPAGGRKTMYFSTQGAAEATMRAREHHELIRRTMGFESATMAA